MCSCLLFIMKKRVKKKSSKRKIGSLNKNLVMGVVVLIVLFLVIVNFTGHNTEEGFGTAGPFSFGDAEELVNEYVGSGGGSVGGPGVDDRLIIYYDFEEDSTREDRFLNKLFKGTPIMQRWKGEVDFVDSFHEDYGRGISFGNGDTNRILNSHMLRNPIGEEISVGFWVKTDSDEDLTLFKKKSSARRRNGQKGFQLKLNKNNLEWFAGGLGSGTYFISCEEVDFSDWAYLVVTAKIGGDKAIYVNGEECARGPSGTAGMNAPDNWFWGTNLGFIGAIDEVKVWDRELSEKEVGEKYNSYGYIIKSDIIDHRIRFFVDPLLVEGQDLEYTKDIFSKYVRDVNIVYSKTTNRNFVFNPEEDLEIGKINFDLVQQETGCDHPCIYPSKDFDVRIYLEKRYKSGFGGISGVNGDSIIYMTYPNLHDLDDLSLDSEDGLWFHSSLLEGLEFINVLIHEIAHSYGVASGEYYSMIGINDLTNKEPLVDISFPTNGVDDPYWGEKLDYFRDPMLTFPFDYENYLEETRLRYLNKVKFSKLSSHIISSGEFRYTFDKDNLVPNIHDSRIIVKDGEGSPVSGADLFVYKIKSFRPPFTATLNTNKISDENGEVEFDWMRLDPHGSPFNNLNNLILIKAYKQGYNPSVKYFSIFDAQEQKLLEGKSELEIEIVMDQLS